MGVPFCHEIRGHCCLHQHRSAQEVGPHRMLVCRAGAGPKVALDGALLTIGYSATELRKFWRESFIHVVHFKLGKRNMPQ